MKIIQQKDLLRKEIHIHVKNVEEIYVIFIMYIDLVYLSMTICMKENRSFFALRIDDDFCWKFKVQKQTQ